MTGTTPPALSSAPAVVVERPPPGLGRGRFEGPAWLIAVLAAVALALTATFYLRRLRRPRTLDRPPP